MTDEHSLKMIDNLVFRFAHQTRVVSQKKNGINQQIKVRRAEIAEAKSNIEATKKNIKSLEEDIRGKQSSLTQNKALTKRMKATNGILLHYEQTLKAELERKKSNYSRDREAYEKRIAGYRATFQSHKEFYYNNPLAQSLLGLQAENRETEARIKSYEDQIISKLEELDNLTAPAINTASPEKLYESVSEQLSEKEPEKQQETEGEKDLPIQLCQTEITLTPEDVYEEENEEAQNTAISSFSFNTEHDGFSQQMDEQSHQQEAETEVKEQEAGPQDQALEQQFTVLEIEQAMEEEMDDGAIVNGDKAIINEADKTLSPFSQKSSQETNQQASPARAKANLATPTFPFTFSPGRSPQVSDSDKSPAFSFNFPSDKSPAFSFNFHSEPSTPGFFGFGIDVGSSQQEESAFSSSFFGEKKTTESKTSMEFLFNQPEPSEDFQFSFGAKSPDKNVSNKDKARDDFPFSFNF